MHNRSFRPPPPSKPSAQHDRVLLPPWTPAVRAATTKTPSRSTRNAAGRAGRRHGRLQRRRGGQRHGHLVHPAASSAAGSSEASRRPPMRGSAARDGHLRRQRQPRHLQRRQCQPAVRRHGHHAGRGGVPRRACWWAMSAIRALPPARRPSAADHARPLAAAGADRRRPDHARAGRVFGQQEPGHARRRRRGHGAARNAPARGATPATCT